MTTKTDEQERAQFEAWYRLHHGSLNVYGRDASGEYIDKQVQGAFNVWQARAALIDLADDIRAALQSQDREDAERYRWLRQQRTISDHACVTWNIGHDWVQMDGAELDAAIDAAIDAAMSKEGRMSDRYEKAWNEGFDFAMKACGWQEGEDPATEGLYVARDSKGNVEVGMWYAKTVTQPAEWTREFRDVDRDDIVAWMAIPEWRAKHGHDQ